MRHARRVELELVGGVAGARSVIAGLDVADAQHDLVLERDDLTLRYKPVAFDDPAEVIVLPESIESLTIVRHGLQSTRRTTTFSGYRRFLTGGRIVKGG